MANSLAFWKMLGKMHFQYHLGTCILYRETREPSFNNVPNQNAVFILVPHAFNDSTESSIKYTVQRRASLNYKSFEKLIYVDVELDTR